MQQITKTDEFDLWVAQLERPFKFLAPFGGNDFALLLVVVDSAITDDERDAVSKEIVRQGCRYAVCTGQLCSRWDDSIDLAYITTHSTFLPPDERFVMTTWHNNEPLEDVARFFRRNTGFGNFVPQHYLVLILGGDAGTVQRIRSALDMFF